MYQRTLACFARYNIFRAFTRKCGADKSYIHNELLISLRYLDYSFLLLLYARAVRYLPNTIPHRERMISIIWKIFIPLTKLRWLFAQRMNRFVFIQFSVFCFIVLHFFQHEQLTFFPAFGTSVFSINKPMFILISLSNDERWNCFSSVTYGQQSISKVRRCL